MKITVRRTGGVAGLTATWQVRVEEQPDRDEWIRLVETLPWPERPAADGHKAGRPVEQAQPDRFIYVIRVSRRRITLPERQLDGAWRELVQRVRQAAV